MIGDTIFQKETDFQESPIGKIPKDWAVQELGDESVADIIAGQSPPSSTYNKENLGLPFLQGKMEFGEMFPSPTICCSKPIKVAEKDDILLSVRAPVGDVNIASFECCIGRGLAAIRAKVDKLEPLFLFYYLKFEGKRFEALSTGSTFKAIRMQEIRKFSIPLPSAKEQKGIVRVFGVVDSAILKVDEVIWKAERLKKGMMQQLLTRGIGHKEYKDTPLGKTPKTWQVVKLKDVAEIRGNKSVNGYERIAFIPMELVPDSQILAKYEIRRKDDVKSSTYCEAGDLLLAKITPSLENGKQGIVPSDVPNRIALATTEVFPLSCKGINKFFLFYVLKFSKFRNKIISSMIGTTGRQRASKESVERLEIPLPTSDEQGRIVEILSNADKRLELERNQKTRLERIKQGLMDLLLTGKIRAKVS
jgi:type I restriction enzyme S subunit